MALDTTDRHPQGHQRSGETILIAFYWWSHHLRFPPRLAHHLDPRDRDPDLVDRRFFIMYVAGFSINILTLLAIVLATGIVVDDAIVVLENIYAKIEGGMDPMKAGHEGSRRRSPSPSSAPPSRLRRCSCPSSSSAALTGRLFREFGVVVAGIGAHQRSGLAHAHAHDERALAETPRQTQPLLRDHRALLRMAHRRLLQLARKIPQAQALAHLPGHHGDLRGHDLVHRQ
jgi:hypothetical protein